MKLCCKFLSMTLLSNFYVQWVMCRSTTESDLFFFNPSVSRISYKDQLNVKYIGRNRAVSGVVIHGNIPRYKLITPATSNRVLGGVFRNKYNRTKEFPSGYRSNYKIFPPPTTCKTDELVNGITSTNIKDAQLRSTRKPNSKLLDRRKDRKVYTVFRRTTVAPLLLNSSSVTRTWRSRDYSNLNRRTMKYFEDVKSSIKPSSRPKPKHRAVIYSSPPPTLETNAVQTVMKNSLNSRREVKINKRIKIIGAQVDINHTTSKHKTRLVSKRPKPTEKSLKQEQHALTPAWHSISNKATVVSDDSVLLNTDLKKAPKRSTNKLNILFTSQDDYIFTKTTEMTGINSEDKLSKTHKVPRKPTVVSSDHVKFFELYDRHDEYGEEPQWKIKDNIVSVTPATNRAEIIRREIKATQVPVSESDLATTVKNYWREYPYMALYAFEPDGIYCDAAGVSEHWLLTSAACLLDRSNTQLELASHGSDDADGNAAYVTYCGARWDQPERINYVVSVLVHPRYRKEHTHHNLGVVKVVTSMAACEGWQAVQVWTHRVPSSTPALALGWQLNGRRAKEDNEKGNASADSLALNPFLKAQDVSLSYTACQDLDIATKLTSGSDTEDIKLLLSSEADVTYCVSAQRSTQQPCGAPGVLMAGGRLLGLWAKELTRKRDVVAVYSAVWCADTDWLRKTTREDSTCAGGLLAGALDRPCIVGNDVMSLQV